MQGSRAPPNLSGETRPYTSDVSRKANPARGPRPKQGAHLLALRQQIGLTQAELARFLGVAQVNIAFWEWSDKPPRSDVLPMMAKAFRVRVDELLVGAHLAPLPKRAGPVGEVQKVFEEVRRLPRKQQRRILDTVTALVEQYRRKAS